MEEDKDMEEKRSAERTFISNDIWIGAFLAIVATIFLLQALKFPGESVYFPSVMLIALLLTSLGVFGLGIWKTVQVKQKKAEYTNPELRMRPFIVFISVIVYVFCIDKIGFFVTSAIYLPCEMLLFGQRNLKIIIISTVGCLACLYFIFVAQMQIHMPQAIFF